MNWVVTQFQNQILYFVQDDNSTGVILSSRLCENSVHGSTKLTTNAVVSLKIEYLSVRPERGRRAPREFSHSLAERRIFPAFISSSSHTTPKMSHYYELTRVLRKG
jgi:hypothetical protein